ncbi:isoleucine--tRNA ligase, mitochondrial [Planococcus citri]|uniref:isoleucine--tRNA ligase, mitochondrial n=1 Tax=Planococcus citri TaxID=170843 RepID=UPI0031F83456
MNKILKIYCTSIYYFLLVVRASIIDTKSLLQCDAFIETASKWSTISEDSFEKAHIIIKRCASSRKRGNTKKYDGTVILPTTNFPLFVKREERISTDEHIEKEANFKDLYNWQRENIKGPEYVLHDGPPYANGPAHLGHAINKILKDIFNRQNLLKGHKVHYKPGWDCHGLPIELKALSDVEANSINISALDVRNKAKNFAISAIERQKSVFKTWGILADWDKGCYYTFDKEYVQNQIKLFYALYEKKLIYRDLKPVHWSPSSRTALAEAELEYVENHISRAITVRFRIDSNSISEFFEFPDNSNLYALIWTTTPWTIPANKAISYSENLSYSIVKIDNSSDVYLIASDLISSFNNLTEKSAEVLKTIPGKNLSNLKYEHPFEKDIVYPFIAGSHVSSSKGTGLVHCAPAHGPEDFVLGIKYKLSTDCIVDELGRYTKEAGKNLEGLDVLNSGNAYVLKALEDDILSIQSFKHSYPYDWRTKKPTILRASEQWFINTASLKNEAFECLKNVSISTEINSRRLSSLLEERPFWCISRQRVWGVPIPVLYNKESNIPMIDQNLIDHYCYLIGEYGTDFWWKLPVKELLPGKLSSDSENIRKSEDILDIWFDSGISWFNALEGDKIADLYLEGNDQCTGWFQSSLLMSVALRKSAPFKNVFVHGFVVDDKGHKMSKSLGNVIDPQDIIRGKGKEPALGIDVMRWWVASHAAFDAQIPVTQTSVKNSRDTVQRLRHCLRFILGNLKGFKLEYTSTNFRILDKYILHRIYSFHDEIQKQYNSMYLNRVCATIINFVTNDISAVYLHATKDRMYCDAEYSEERLSCQTVYFHVLEFLLRAIAPIVPHLVEECYMHHPVFAKNSTYFRSPKMNPLEEWNNSEIMNVVQVFLKLKEEICRANKKPNELSVTVKLSNPIIEAIKAYRYEELLEILQVAELKVESECSADFEIVDFRNTTHRACERCWKFICGDNEEICSRCSDVINKKAELAG